VKCFCSMHELAYETKAMGKEQYHNNFGCYGFTVRPNASYPVPEKVALSLDGGMVLHEE
jgi:hypothetical protein